MLHSCWEETRAVIASEGKYMDMMLGQVCSAGTAATLVLGNISMDEGAPAELRGKVTSLILEFGSNLKKIYKSGSGD